MKLQQIITSDRIRLDVEAGSSEEVIKILIEALAESGAIEHPDLVQRAVIDRERQVGTGIGSGVAIPHAEPGPYLKPIAAFGRLRKPVNFHAPDGKKADLIFLLLTPDQTPALHVRLLARICRLTRSENFRRQLREASTPDEAARKIAELETDYPELTP